MEAAVTVLSAIVVPPARVQAIDRPALVAVKVGTTETGKSPASEIAEVSAAKMAATDMTSTKVAATTPHVSAATAARKCIGRKRRAAQSDCRRDNRDLEE